MNNKLPVELEALAVQLEDAWDARYGIGSRQLPTRSRKRVVRLPRLLVLPVAAAAVAGLLLVRTSGPGSVKQAIAAVGTTPAGTIVHFTSVSRDYGGDLIQRTEFWAATDVPYGQRSILQSGDSAPIEQGAAGNDVTQYDPAGIVYVRTSKGGVAAGNRPADFAPNAGQIKQYLRSSNTRDDGVVTVGDQMLHRFTITRPDGGTCIYDVDPDSFYAVNFSCTGLPTGTNQVHWEYLPRAGNESLLSVAAQHPSATRDIAPMQTCGPERHTAATPPCVVNSPGG